MFSTHIFALAYDTGNEGPFCPDRIELDDIRGKRENRTC